MPIEDENVDPIYQKMVAAREGDPETWGRVNRALRDAMVDHAVRRCPYYRKVVPGHGGFRDIPMLTKEIIQENFDDLLAEGIPEERRVPKRTSGTTGEPFAFYRDTSQGPMEYISAQRFLKRSHGVTDELSQVWVTLRPPTSAPDGTPLRSRRLPWPPRRRGRPTLRPVPTLRLTSDRVRKEVREWPGLGRYFLYGHASALHRIAEEIEESALPFPVPPASVVTTADNLTHHMEALLARVFRAPIHSWYGSHEFNGYVAGTVPGTRRYVFNPLLVHAEVLGDDGRPARPGDTGRLVLTDLNNYVMPFVRYDTGDVAVASDRPSGGWPAVEEVVGRSSEVVRLPSGAIVTPAALTYALFTAGRLDPHIRVCQCAQTGPNRLELRVVWRRPPTDEVRTRVVETFRTATDPDTAVSMRDIEQVDRTPSGKTWLVRREIG